MVRKPFKDAIVIIPLLFPRKSFMLVCVDAAPCTLGAHELLEFDLLTFQTLLPIIICTYVNLDSIISSLIVRIERNATVTGIRTGIISARMLLMVPKGFMHLPRSAVILENKNMIISTTMAMESCCTWTALRVRR
jgi:hypothetical protein